MKSQLEAVCEWLKFRPTRQRDTSQNGLDFVKTDRLFTVFLVAEVEDSPVASTKEFTSSRRCQRGESATQP